MSNTKSTKLQPMAIRVTPRQFALLQALKSEDGISVQDHIRRALDNYLRRAPDPAAPPVSASIAALEPNAVPAAPAKPWRQQAPILGPVDGDEAPLADPAPARVQSRRQQVAFR